MLGTAPGLGTPVVGGVTGLGTPVLGVVKGLGAPVLGVSGVGGIRGRSVGIAV